MFVFKGYSMLSSDTNCCKQASVECTDCEMSSISSDLLLLKPYMKDCLVCVFSAVQAVEHETK